MIKLAVGERNAYKLPVSSTKGATGHCLGAASAVGAIFTVLATQRGAAADDQLLVEDPEVRPRLRRTSTPGRHQIGVSNSFGFGGHNACVVFRKHDEE